MSEEANKPNTAPGTIGWNEVVTTNKGASVEFYSKLFGWSTEEMELPNGNIYTLFKQGDQHVAGCSMEESAPMWLTYINVEDLDVSVAKAKELGGNVVTERVDLPMGSFAIVADPVGAVFAFWQMNPNGDC